jgi:Zn-dependent metalloprotease
VDKNTKGEVHEHWSLIGYDSARKLVTFRQFHQEGFVATYVLNPAASTPGKVVFESENLENIGASWRARETYELISSDEFVETFELSQSGKPFEVYSKTHFKRSIR